MSIEKATVVDIPLIKSIVDAAFTKYIKRIGRKPGPMTANYDHLLTENEVYVLRAEGKLVGSIVLGHDSDSIKINNRVVDPAAQGHGYGRVLMQHAEDLARQRGFTALTLYTNVKMYENLALYPKMGFVEVERRMEDGFDRAFFRMKLL